MRKLEILLGCVCVLVILGLFANSVRTNAKVANAEFRRLTDDSIDSLQVRMSTYLSSLNATAAFLESSSEVTRAEFDRFVSQLEIERYLPGINGIGYITPIQSGQEQQLVDEMAALGEPDLNIHPLTDNAQKYIINRISPIGPNVEALGLDISFEEGRRNSANAARETGLPQLTPRILLVQEHSSQPGFLLLRPVYYNDTGEVRPDPAVSRFKGFVYAPFVGRNLLTNLTANQGVVYQFSVFDGTTTDMDQLIYASESDSEAPSGKYTATYTFENYGRKWTVLYESTLPFEATFRNTMAWTLLIGGLVLSAMLVFSVRSLRIRGDATHELAQLRERQISAREEENRAVVENAVTAVFILDGQRKILFANQAAQESFGYSPRQIKGLLFDDLVSAAHDQDETSGVNATGTTREGAELVLDLHYNEWTTFEGAPRVTAIVRDLTRETEAREEIRITKIRYDQALQGAGIGVFDVNLETGHSDVTDTWREIMGVDPSETDIDAQDNFLSRVHPEDLPVLLANDAACIEGKTARSISEYRIKFSDNEWRWMRSEAVVVNRNKEGKALRMIGTQADITELHNSRHALEASEKRFRQVLSAAPIGMVLMDNNGRFLGVNDAFCALAGYSEEDLLANVRMPDMMSKDERKKLYSAISDLMNSDGSHVYTGEHRIVNSNGTERWGLFHTTWAYDKNKDEHYFISQIIDITDQKKIEQIKNEFVSTVSHELRTPLTSIKGALGLVLATGSDQLEDAKKRLIDIALSNTERLTTIVNDILDLEKISSGEVDFVFQDLDMTALINEAVRENSPFATTHKNTLRFEHPDEPLNVSADFNRSKQVLANLISNACKYSDPETEVLIKAEQLEGKVIVYIQNRGPGIPDNFKPLMFQAFSQADSSDTRAKGGTGLGLNITKQIVTRHQGEIGFESTPDGITVFWFTYPSTAEDTLDDPVAAPNVKRLPRRGKARVLHIEDDYDFAEVVKSGLSKVADVTHAGSLEEARKCIKNGNLDLLIVDWSLPDGDASELFDDIDQILPNVTVLGLSSDGNRRRDSRVTVNLEKSRTELSTIAEYVSSRMAKVS